MLLEIAVNGQPITPQPIDVAYPTLLEAPAPHLRAYPPETVIAEKVEALVSLGWPTAG